MVRGESSFKMLFLDTIGVWKIFSFLEIIDLNIVKGNILTLGLSSFSVAAPRLHEYVVQAARTLPSLLSNGDIDLDGTFAANKLAVCLGDGASYDKHLDNSGQGCV